MDFKYIYYRYVDALINRLSEKILKKKIIQNKCGSKQIISKEACNSKIFDAICNNRPYMVARYGSTEMLAICGFLDKKNHLKRNIPDSTIEQMERWSGFFPKEKELLECFCEMMIEQSINADLLGIWNQMDVFMVERYAKNASICKLSAIEPWYTPSGPWTAALKGKKVLVIHPFSETILNQYKKRELIFPGTEILPLFELYTIKAVQTLAGEPDKRFSNWFEALDWMFDEAMKVNFDVAILGCGAYGFPLAARLKREGKIAIHMGGAVQLLFGIKGKRWDNHPVISKFYNDNWVRPNSSEKPKGASKVESVCYW